MVDNANLRDALIELENLRTRDARLRLESETLQKSLELLAQHKPSRSTIQEVFAGIAIITESKMGLLAERRQSGLELVSRYGAGFPGPIAEASELFQNWGGEEHRN
ncbi:MAG: hypothetical protein ACPGYL_02350, partial [Rhodospirillaceae bacterium]